MRSGRSISTEDTHNQGQISGQFIPAVISRDSIEHDETTGERYRMHSKDQTAALLLVAVVTGQGPILFAG